MWSGWSMRCPSRPPKDPPLNFPFTPARTRVPSSSPPGEDPLHPHDRSPGASTHEGRTKNSMNPPSSPKRRTCTFLFSPQKIVLSDGRSRTRRSMILVHSRGRSLPWTKGGMQAPDQNLPVRDASPPSEAPPPPFLPSAPPRTAAVRPLVRSARAPTSIPRSGTPSSQGRSITESVEHPERLGPHPRLPTRAHPG